MINNYFNRQIQLFLFLLVFLFEIQVNAQVIISYGGLPAAENIRACNGSSKLYVRLDATAASVTGANVTITLPVGVTYVSGSVTTISGTAGITIIDDLTGTVDPTKPRFVVSGSLALASHIEFSINRQSSCIAGANIKDAVTATSNGIISTENNPSLNSYISQSPVLSFIQPSAQNNAVINTNYTRTFTIKNGSGVATNSVYFSIDYPVNGIQQTALTLAGSSIVPTNTVGTISYYTLTGLQLGADSLLTNGESLVLSETYKIKTCGASTTYKVGWGCSSLPSSWCQTLSGTGVTSMIIGTPILGAFTIVKNNYIDSCTPFTTTATYKNTGSGNDIAATMFDATFRVGGVTDVSMAAFGFDYVNFLSATINGVSVPVVGGTSSGIVSVNVNDKFATDPDGLGIGLDDIDGDGFYDDLPPGKTVTLVFASKINCSKSCPQIVTKMYYGVNGDVQYNSMCSNKGTSQNINGGNPFRVEIATLDNKSYADTNVFGDTTFNARFSVGYYVINTLVFDTDNTRYRYVITLPAGVSYVGTPIWHYKQYPNEALLAGLTPDISQSGNILMVTSPNNLMGWFSLNLKYNCAEGTGGVITIPYTLKRLDNIVTNCITCNSDLFCSNLVLENVICSSNACLGGVSLTAAKVERADNSLGYTDGTFATRQSRAAISSYDLAKALYLDEIGVTANGIQSAISSNNVFMRFNIKKTTGTDNKLSPIDILVTVKRGGIIQTSGTLNSFVMTSSTTTNQIIDWDLTALVPLGGLLPDDTIETYSRYTVSSVNLPTHDIQMGKEIYLYNMDNSGNKLSCSLFIPEIYLLKPVYVDANNPSSVNSCDKVNIGNSTNYYGFRFDSLGTLFLNEVRPGFLPVSYEFTLPAGYIFDRVSNPDYGGNLVPTSIVGSTYHFDLAAKKFPILVTNSYSTIFSVYVYPSYFTQATENYISKLTYIPYYYHYIETSPLPQVVGTKTLAINYNIITKPAIALSNQTGTIQAYHSTESFVVRMASIGTTTAPFTWLSIPDIAGVIIKQVVDISSNTVLTPIPYSGGVWYQISALGLASSAFKDYRIDFSYSTCALTTFSVGGGWDCSGFPIDPSASYLGGTTADFTFTSAAQIETNSVNQPSEAIKLCDSTPYEFNINNTQVSDLTNSTFSVDCPIGMSIASGSFEVQYPANTGTWFTLPASAISTTGMSTTFNLTVHPNYPETGIPGIISASTNNDRLLNVKFNTTTNCDFISGTKFKYYASAMSPCGSLALGSNVKLSSVANRIIGTDSGYITVSSLEASASFDNCSTAPIKIKALNTIIIGSGSTNTDDYILFEIPQGYDYVTESFACTSTACPHSPSVVTSAEGVKSVKLIMPVGLTAGDAMSYSIEVYQTGITACGATSISLQTLHKVKSIPCGTGACTDFISQTGTSEFLYTNKPSFEITSFTGTVTGTNYSLTTVVKNTGLASDIANPITIDYYCADAQGNPTGTLLGSQTMTGTIAAGSTLTENSTLIGVTCSTSSKLVAVISTASNCACSTVSKIFDLLPVATDDMSCFQQGNGVSINVLTNDTIGDIIIPTTVRLVAPSGATGIVKDSSGDVTSMTIIGQGTWSVNLVTGMVTFTPSVATLSVPTVVQYHGRDAEGNVSNDANINLTGVATPVSGGNITQCITSPIQTLTAVATIQSGQTIVWYTAPTGGSIVTNLNWSTLGTVTYYAEGENGSCSSTTRTAVTLALDALPTTPVVAVNQPSCTLPTSSIEITSPLGSGYTYSLNGTSYQSNPVFSGYSANTYNITVKNVNGCISVIAPVTINPFLTNVSFVGATVTSCALNGSGYVVIQKVSGLAPYTATGTGAPGIWSGTTWTSSQIPRGTDYNVDFQDANICNKVNTAAVAPICCLFAVSCPTFPVTTLRCYKSLPTATSLTKIEFETLGNADGVIGNVTCGVIAITATNAARLACESNVVRTYTITQYADPNNNGIRDIGEDTVLNTQNCTQTFILEHNNFTMPANQASTVACVTNCVLPTVPLVVDNCGTSITGVLLSTVDSPVSISCEGTRTYNYTFTDCSGLVSNWKYVYTIDHTTVAVVPADGFSTVECLTSATTPTPPTMVVDVCGTSLTGVLVSTVDLPVSISCEGTRTYNYTFTDCSGLVSNWKYVYTAVSTQKPSIALIKTATLNDKNQDGSGQEGGVITYHFEILNTGNVPLINITISDELSGLVLSGGPITLLPGQINTTSFIGTYIVTVQDIKNEKVVNQATVFGTSPQGVIVQDFSDYSSFKGGEPTVLVLKACEIKVFNLVTPNEDKENDFLYIEGLDCYVNNSVEIYNRWGVLVYSASGYNNEEVSFKGYLDGRASINSNEGLPEGTYYYILKYTDFEEKVLSKAGFLYLKK